LEERAVAHGGPGIEGLCDWLIARTGATPELIGVAIEITHGPVVEALLERGWLAKLLPPDEWPLSALSCLFASFRKTLLNPLRRDCAPLRRWDRRASAA
jgi:hypothetical protein